MIIDEYLKFIGIPDLHGLRVFDIWARVPLAAVLFAYIVFIERNSVA